MHEYPIKWSYDTIIEKIIKHMSEVNRITDLLELKDVEVTQFKSYAQENHIFISVPRTKHSCPVCGQLSDVIHDYRTQRILDVPLYEKKPI